MTNDKQSKLYLLAAERIQIATKHLERGRLRELIKAITEEAEIPGFENKTMKFGKFVNKEFVAMMTDIRKSSDIINSYEGDEKMFKIFYSYAAVVASIVDSHGGTSTEFLGDGVVNLFDTDSSREEALINAYKASKEILEARQQILNPLYFANDLPLIDIGIGIDYGQTIVTRFGHNGDNDLKAFGKCVYNASKLCKGNNTIQSTQSAKEVWPSGPNGTLIFSQVLDSENNLVYELSNTL